MGFIVFGSDGHLAEYRLRLSAQPKANPPVRIERTLGQLSQDLDRSLGHDDERSLRGIDLP